MLSLGEAMDRVTKPRLELELLIHNGLKEKFFDGSGVRNKKDVSLTKQRSGEESVDLFFHKTRLPI